MPRLQARTTERVHPAARGVDALPPLAILDHLLSQQFGSLAAVREALPAIADGAALLASALSGGGSIAYAGAGSSALMAVADGMELNGTYGIPTDRIRLIMAGGLPTDAGMPGGTEDDEGAGRQAGAALRSGDAVICVTASGSTPFALGVARGARANGARVIGLANNPGAPLFELSDVAICASTPPEVIAGSTRMGAGTAQKACLNLMSTLMAIHLGQVHDGRMVGVIADNAKLRARAAGMVSDIAECEADVAEAAIRATGGAVKPAVLVALGLSANEAVALLDSERGSLRRALAALPRPTTNKPKRPTGERK